MFDLVATGIDEVTLFDKNGVSHGRISEPAGNYIKSLRPKTYRVRFVTNQRVVYTVRGLPATGPVDALNKAIPLELENQITVRAVEPEDGTKPTWD